MELINSYPPALVIAAIAGLFWAFGAWSDWRLWRAVFTGDKVDPKLGDMDLEVPPKEPRKGVLGTVLSWWAWVKSLVSNRTGAPTMRQRQRGFTLIELMIVIAIIGILASIVRPYLKPETVDENGQRVEVRQQDSGQQKQITYSTR